MTDTAQNFEDLGKLDSYSQRKNQNYTCTIGLGFKILHSESRPKKNESYLILKSQLILLEILLIQYTYARTNLLSVKRILIIQIQQI
jgi:hypothetical protein